MRNETGADSRGGFTVVGKKGNGTDEPDAEERRLDSTHDAEAPLQTLKPKIFVLGLGGAGGNAIRNMLEGDLTGVELIAANTDAQALESIETPKRIQLGRKLTSGLGAGARPEVGRGAAEESIDQILAEVEGASLVFIAAGMGGGTGTGASPVVAEAIRKQGVLTVAVVTKPFRFEGSHRMEVAEQGIRELQDKVDTLIVIPNQNLFRVATEETSVADAFYQADNVLFAGVRGVTDLMLKPGLINLDFADFRTVMTLRGKAIMGAGEAEGTQRAKLAAEAAVANPLLEDSTVEGARGVLINVTGGSDLTLFELDEAVNSIRDKVHADANIILGSSFDEDLKGRLRVSVLATGIADKPDPESIADKPPTERDTTVETVSESEPTINPAPGAIATAPKPDEGPGQTAEAPSSERLEAAPAAPVESAPVESAPESQSAANPDLPETGSMEPIRTHSGATAADEQEPLEVMQASPEQVFDAEPRDEALELDDPTLEEIIKRAEVLQQAAAQERAEGKTAASESPEMPAPTEAPSAQAEPASAPEPSPVKEPEDFAEDQAEDIDHLIEQVLQRNRQAAQNTEVEAFAEPPAHRSLPDIPPPKAVAGIVPTAEDPHVRIPKANKPVVPLRDFDPHAAGAIANPSVSPPAESAPKPNPNPGPNTGPTPGPKRRQGAEQTPAADSQRKSEDQAATDALLEDIALRITGREEEPDFDGAEALVRPDGGWNQPEEDTTQNSVETEPASAKTPTPSNSSDSETTDKPEPAERRERSGRPRHPWFNRRVAKNKTEGAAPPSTEESVRPVSWAPTDLQDPTAPPQDKSDATNEEELRRSEEALRRMIKLPSFLRDKEE